MNDSKLSQVFQANRELSDAYLRLRTKLKAFDTPTAPTAQQVWDHTEARLDALLQELEQTKELVVLKNKTIDLATQCLHSSAELMLLNSQALVAANQGCNELKRKLDILSEAVQQVLQFKPNGLNECAYECAVWDNLQTAYNETKQQ